MTKFFLFLFLSVSAIEIYTQAKPPRLFVHKGACPFECCIYRQWKVEKTTILYARPNLRAGKVGRVLAGTHVRALTGEVWTSPGKFTVKKVHEKYKPGDVLWVYTYLGEGFFKVWFGGRMREESLDFSPGGGSSGTRCQDSNYCWGEMDENRRSTWWIKIRSRRGLTGWTNQGENFSGADQCS